MAGKFQIRSRKWDIGILIASIAGLAIGFGGLFVLQAAGNSTGTPTLLFVVVLGILTFLAFAGPGLVYVLRKRVKAVKAKLPGGTMPWIRSHLYLPILALVLAVVHASVVPFRGQLSSGKVLLALGVLVSIGGVARHHLIGIQKAALNVNVNVGKMTTGQPRAFRRLVTDYLENARSRADVDAAVAQMDPSVQTIWSKITAQTDEIDKHFPRSGGQSWHIRQYKLWRALHPPLTVALFVVLAFHVWDVLGGTRAVAGDDQAFASASECADCHSERFEEWSGSTMSHSQISTINEAQLPITLAENARIVDEFDDTESLSILTGRDLDDDSQQEALADNGHVCIDCHAPVGGSFTDNPLELLPFGADGSPVSGNAAVTSDGVGCIVCHTQSVRPAERAGNDELVSGAVDGRVSLGSYGSMYGPPFTDPNPLPVRIHGIDTAEELWGSDTDDPEAELEVSQLCGACHNVKLDVDGDGVTDVDGAREQGIVQVVGDIDDGDDLDEDDDFILDENELDDDRVQTRDGQAVDDDGGDGLIDDLVLQTTYDEWQDYVAFFDEDGGFTDRYADAEFPNELDDPLGCTSCHMPLEGDGEEPVVDEAPGFLPLPDRDSRRHSFVGVDYDLDPALYRDAGLSDEDIAKVVAERDALVQSAATLQVTTADAGNGLLDATVTVRNNLLAHSFPTGFAFARQFWIEVSAETTDGEPVCLAAAFVDGNGAAVGNTPCGSGFADAQGTEPVEGDDELLQCDVAAVANALPDDATLPFAFGDFFNDDIRFAAGASFGIDDCDPWLANFQKILTDGDPDLDGTRQEVPYQPLLPDAVKIRGQVATGNAMFELQPVRLRDGAPTSTADIPYVFALPDGVSADDVVVTARLRFRHLPPYFVRDLESRQQALLDDDEDAVPPGARIDADELLRHMVVTEVTEASSDDPTEQLTCEGPQNDEPSILDCISDRDVEDVLAALDLGGGGRGRGRIEREDGLGTSGGFATVALPGLVAPAAWWRRRRRAGAR